MKKKNLVFCVLAVLICLNLSGCAKVYELTEADEEMIAVYCAKTVSKFNTIKAQGYTNLIGSDLKELYAASENTDEVVEEETASEEVLNPETGEPLSADITDVSETIDVTDDTVTDASSSASLTDALAIAGLTFDFKSVSAMDYYSIGGYANITPSRGKQFLVVTYNVVNSTDADVAVDIPSTGIKFKAVVGGVSNTSDGTIVPTDLSVYKGAIPAGHTQEMVLLFQFEPDALTDLSGLKLQMVQGTSATNIIF